MYETVQDLKMETESINKTQTEGIVKLKIQEFKKELQRQASPTECKKMEQRISGVEETIEVKKKVKSKNLA